ncbi:hypothetical protein GA0070612_5297 [Micromonospora chokoriensis]|uniref:Uncharacterized protein n=1 Tax=Micromonospora chokoriensis TaxID=356851 RepID=A0A1C4YV66_9ACTN|nr:hypothetical protein GA0070612_5297 [Micromonospora chokoriensis]
MRLGPGTRRVGVSGRVGGAKRGTAGLLRYRPFRRPGRGRHHRGGPRHPDGIAGAAGRRHRGDAARLGAAGLPVRRQGTSGGTVGGRGPGDRRAARSFVDEGWLRGARRADGGPGRTLRTGTWRAVRTRGDRDTGSAVGTRTRWAVHSRRHRGTSRTLRTGGAASLRTGAGWAVGAAPADARRRGVPRSDPSGWGGAGSATSRCGRTAAGRGASRDVRFVAAGPGSTRTSRAVGAGFGRRTTSPTGRIDGGRPVRTGPDRRTTTPIGRIRRGRRSTSTPAGSVAGRRRIGQSLLAGGT